MTKKKDLNDIVREEGKDELKAKIDAAENNIAEANDENEGGGESIDAKVDELLHSDNKTRKDKVVDLEEARKNRGNTKPSKSGDNLAEAVSSLGIPTKGKVKNENPKDIIRPFLAKHKFSIYYDLFNAKYTIDQTNDDGTKETKALNDLLVMELWSKILDEGISDLTDSMFRKLLEAVGIETKIHPVREYFKSLEWDGIPRLDSWIEPYLDDTKMDDLRRKYSLEVGRIMILAIVRRVMHPGAKFDEMPILESPQGYYKSTLLKKLAIREEWFCDSIKPSDSQQKIIEQTHGKLIVEYAEMANIRKADNEHNKATLSRTVDSARLAYGHFSSEVPRQYIWVGTMNVRNKDDKYLTDQTGNRRYWPLMLKKIDIVHFEKNLTQLYAEAVVREGKGESIVMSEEIANAAKREQELRLMEMGVDNVLVDYLGFIESGAILVEDVRKLVMRGSKGKISWYDDKEMGVVMTDMGFERRRVRWDNKIRYGYVKGDTKDKYEVIDANGRMDVVKLSIVESSDDSATKPPYGYDK